MGCAQVARLTYRASELTRFLGGKPLEAKAQQGAGQDDMNNNALVFEERHRRRQGNQGRGKLKIALMVKKSIPANSRINATALTATAANPATSRSTQRGQP